MRAPNTRLTPACAEESHSLSLIRAIVVAGSWSALRRASSRWRPAAWIIPPFPPHGRGASPAWSNSRRPTLLLSPQLGRLGSNSPNCRSPSWRRKIRSSPHGAHVPAIEKAYALNQHSHTVRGASPSASPPNRQDLFLWSGRQLFRKGLEAYFTLFDLALLAERRILEVYLTSPSRLRHVLRRSRRTAILPQTAPGSPR